MPDTHDTARLRGLPSELRRIAPPQGSAFIIIEGEGMDYAEYLNNLASAAADRIEALEAGMRPFREWADWFDSCDQHPNGCPDEALAGESVEITVGQLRAARALLEGERG